MILQTKNKRKDQIEEDEDDDLTLDDLKKKLLHKKIKIEKNYDMILYCNFIFKYLLYLFLN